MCTLTSLSPYQQLLGDEPCRSLFAEYKIDLPKTSGHGSATKNSNKLKVYYLFIYLYITNAPAGGSEASEEAE